VLALHEIERTSVDQDIRRYLKDELSKLVSNRSDLDIAGPWPEESDIVKLVQRSQGLFIFASTTCKFIGSTNGSPPDLLRMITGSKSETLYEGMSGIDGLYTRILEENHSTTLLPTAFERLKSILGAVSLAFDPLSLESLGALLGLKPKEILTCLRPLHSLLLIPDSPFRTVRMLHKSIPDYLTDNQRCRNPRFHVDSGNHHGRLAIRCLELMQSRLRQNICDIPRYAMNDGVVDLAERRKKHIGDTLEYVCKFWAQHLLPASNSEVGVTKIIELLTNFMLHHFLAWLEIMSVTGALRTAVYSLRGVKAWLRRVNLFFFFRASSLLTRT
jgi:hypothetical protein